MAGFKRFATNQYDHIWQLLPYIKDMIMNVQRPGSTDGLGCEFTFIRAGNRGREGQMLETARPDPVNCRGTAGTAAAEQRSPAARGTGEV